MDNAFEIASRALQIGAVGHGFVLRTHKQRIADGAAFRQVIHFLFAGAPFDDRLHYLWDDLASALYQHPVTDTQVFALDVTLVVQCGARNDYAANIDGFEQRPGVDRTRATDIDADIEQLRSNLNGRIFEGVPLCPVPAVAQGR